MLEVGEERERERLGSLVNKRSYEETSAGAKRVIANSPVPEASREDVAGRWAEEAA